jgi:hypothetical protein
MKKKKTKMFLVTSLFLLSYKRCLKLPPCSQTHISAWCEKEDNPKCILHFTCKMLNLKQQFFSGVRCSDTDLILQMSLQTKLTGYRSDESAGQETGASHP